MWTGTDSPTDASPHPAPLGYRFRFLPPRASRRQKYRRCAPRRRPVPLTGTAADADGDPIASPKGLARRAARAPRGPRLGTTPTQQIDRGRRRVVRDDRGRASHGLARCNDRPPSAGLRGDRPGHSARKVATAAAAGLPGDQPPGSVRGRRRAPRTTQPSTGGDVGPKSVPSPSAWCTSTWQGCRPGRLFRPAGR